MSAVTVAILAGGLSTRMGTDKAFVRVHGRPLVERVLAQVAGLGAETLLVANRAAAFAYLGLPVYADVLPGRAALGGVYSALYYAAQPRVLVLACDLPFLSRPLLEYLVALAPQADAIVPRIAGQAEPLHAVYARACLEPIRRRLDAGQRRVVSFYDDVRVRWVDEPELRALDPELRSFHNLNTPDELAAAEDEGPSHG